MTNLDVFSDCRLTFHLISPCRETVVASVENLFSQIVLIFQYLPLNLILLFAFIVQSRKIILTKVPKNIFLSSHLKIPRQLDTVFKVTSSYAPTTSTLAGQRMHPLIGTGSTR